MHHFEFTYIAKITTAHEKIEMMNKNLIWSDVEKLPLWSMAEFEEEALKSQSLILIDGLAVDISLFKLEHPGKNFRHTYRVFINFMYPIHSL